MNQSYQPKPTRKFNDAKKINRRRRLLLQQLEKRAMWAADLTLGVVRPDGGILLDQFLDQDTIANSLPNATPEISFKFGVNSTAPQAGTTGNDMALAGDLSGVGYDQVIVARGLPGVGSALQWLGDTDRDTTQEYIFRFGLNDMTPLIADMNGDGIDDVIAVDRDAVSGLNEWYVSYGAAGANPFPTDDSTLTVDATFSFGFSTDEPQVGDLNGDGRADVIAVREVAADLDWFVSNAAGGATPYPNNTATTLNVDNTISGFGLVGEVPVVGDWDNDGDDNIGRVDEGTSPVTWRLDTDGLGGVAELNPQYGLAGDQYIAGRWADVLWDGGAGNANWSAAANWSGDTLPTLTDTVVIDQPETATTINHDSGSTVIEALTSTESLNITGGNLDLFGAINNVDLADVDVGASGSLTLPDAATINSLDSQGTLTIEGILDTDQTSISLAGTVIGSGLGGVLSDDVTLTGPITFNANGDVSVSGIISGAQPITKEGGFNLNLNAANTFTGALTINDGTVQSNAAGAIPAGTAVAFGPSGTLDLNGFDASLSELTAIAGPEVNLGSATLTVGSGNTNFDYGGGISGTGGLIKVGTGAMTLSGSGSYSGVTEVQAGELIVVGSLGDATGNTIVFGGATLDVANASSGDENIVLDGNSPTLKVGATQINGGIALSATSLATIEATNSSNISGNITGAVTGGKLTITGTDLVLAGTNTYTADTEFTTTGLVGLEGGAALPATSAVTLLGTAELNVADTGLTIGSLAGVAGTFVGSGPSATNLTVGGDGTSTTFDGVIRDSLNIIKEGAGTFTLGGANTYTGNLTINAGTVVAADDDAFGSPSSSVDVANGSTAQLGAGVTITNAISLSDSASLIGADGASQLGSITRGANADVSIEPFDSGSTFTIGGAIIDGAGGSVNFQNAGNHQHHRQPNLYRGEFRRQQ